MKIREIIGEKDRICFLLDGEAEDDAIYTVEVQRPFGVKRIGTFHVKGKEQLFVERYFDKEDLLTARFTVLGPEESGNMKPLEGPGFVTDLVGASVFSASYPKFRTKKTLSECGEDYEKLQIEQTVLNINLPAIMTFSPKKEDLEFQVNGESYFFRKKKIDGNSFKLPKTF